MNYIEVKKDLFTMPKEYALAHCIASDAVMGAGIAVEFNKRYPHMKQDIQLGKYEVSSVVGFKEEKTGNQEIINLITKKKSYNKPTRVDFNQTLEMLKIYVENNNIKKLAIPRIGSGLDKLNWHVTSKQIKHLFRDADIEIVVCIWR